MPRNSKSNSLARFNEIKNIVINYKNNKNNECVTKTFLIINEPYKTILVNTFFKNKNIFWWNDIYSKTTYYRLRNRAVDSFLMIYRNYEEQI